MADRDGERDRRVRELMNNSKKDNFAVLGQAQAEVSDIQSELRNHLAMQQAQDQSRLQQAQTISQAAGGMMAMENEQNLQGQVATMNPQTQAAMSKFGVKPQRRQTQTNTQNSARTVTKAGDVTNIKNEYTTNNKTEIKVTQPSIPIAQPAIQVSQPQRKTEDSTAKFKAWLSGMFAKQQNDAEIQRKEYRKKEWNLGRTTTRLMKRIGEATSNLGSKLDPKNMTSTLGGQLKWLLLIFGATMMAKFWKPTMEFLANLEGGFKAVFGLPMNEDLKSSSHRALSIIDQIKDFIGIKRGEDTTLIGGIGRVFMEGVNKIIDKLKFWFEDRANALKDIEFPSIDTPDFGALGKIMSPMMEGLTNTFQSVAQYLGDIITVAMGGSKGKVKTAARKIAKQSQEVFTNTQGKNLSAGDSGLVQGSGRDYMKKSDFDGFGNLKNNASSTQAMSRSLISLFNDKSGKAHTAEISTGVGQLFDVANRSGKVVIDPALLDYLGMTPGDKNSLIRNKQLVQENYRIIGVQPVTDAQRKELGAYTGKAGFWTGGIVGTAAGAYAGAKLGGLAGSALGPLGTGLGLLGGAAGGALLGWLGSSEGAAVDELVKRWTTKGLYPKLVKADSGEVGADGSMGVPKKMWVLTKEGADYVTSRFTSGMTNKDMDITNKEFYDKIYKIEEKRKRNSGVNGPITQNLSVNELRMDQANLDAYNKRWYDKFESRDPNSENMRNYGHLNTTMDNVGNFISSGISYVSTGLRNGGNFVLQERLGTAEQAKRQAYVISRLMREGLTREQAAGIAGNIMKESSFVANKKVMDNNHKYAGGIVGWNGPNLERVERYFGRDIRQVSFEDQVEYLIKELKGEVNGMKAIDRDGYASRFGFRSGSNIFDIMKQTRGIEEAAVTFERVFEGSGDYKGYKDKNGNWKNGDRDRRRIEYALGAHKSSLSYGDVSNYKSTTPPQINLKELQDEKVKKGETVGAGWLGDSQSCVCGGLFPRLVGEGLGCVFRFYARGSANGAHYTGGNKNTRNLSNPTTNIPGFTNESTCVDAKDWMIANKPKYCFLALGHNGIAGYQNLARQLMGAGIKVIGIKMWSTNAAPGTGMISYSKEKMSKMYDGINLDGFVDLSQLDIPKSKDGVHASKEGCMIAAREVIQQLSGQSPTAGSEEGVTDYLDTQNGLFGNFSEIVSNTLDKAADLLDGENKNKTGINFSDIQLNEEQKKILNKHLKYKNVSNLINVNSFLNLGAKTDETGLFFEDTEGQTRAYVNPGTSTGIMGLTEDNIDFVAKRGEDGKWTGKVSKNEEEMIKRATILRTESLFSNYSGKGTDTDVMMVDGKPMMFDLGYFTDLNFSKAAINQFNIEKKGKIHYKIALTKDRGTKSIVEIDRIANPMVGFHVEEDYIGPIIYKLGWKQRVIVNSKSMVTDWQPLAYYLKVFLTPKAEEKVKQLQKILSYGKLTAQDHKVFSEDGKELSQEEKELAQSLGILSRGTEATVRGGKNAGVSTYSTGYSVKSGYNDAQDTALKLMGNKNFLYKNYISNFNINSEEEKKKFYENNKDFFYTKEDGTIIGPSGVEWGKIGKDGKVTLYDEKTFTERNTQLGTSGFSNNMRWVEQERARKESTKLGAVNRNDIADLFGKIDYKSAITKEEQAELDKKNSVKTDYIVKKMNFMGEEFAYRVFFDESGNALAYQAEPREINRLIKEKTGDDTNYFPMNTKITAKTEKELGKAVYRLVKQRIDKSRNFIKDKSYYDQMDFLPKDFEKGITKNESDKLYNYLISKNRLVSDLYTPPGLECVVIYEDGTKDRTKFHINPDLFNKKEFIEAVNNAIKENKEKSEALRFSKLYEGSNMQKSANAVLEGIKSGELKGTIDENGNVYSSLTGDLVGKAEKDKDGNLIYNNASAEEMLKHYKGRINNTHDMKVGMYRRIMGAVEEDGKLYVYNKARTTRVQLDTSKDFSTDLNSVLIPGSLEGTEDGKKWMNVKDIGDGSYDTKTGKFHNDILYGGISNDKLTNTILDDMKNYLSQNVDLQQEFSDQLASAFEDQLNQDLVAIKKQTEQLIQEKEISKASKKQALIMEEWAKSGFKVTGEISEELTEKLNKLETETNNDIMRTEYSGLVAEKKAGSNALRDYQIIQELDENGNLVNYGVKNNKKYKIRLDRSSNPVIDPNGIEIKQKRMASGPIAFDKKNSIWWNLTDKEETGKDNKNGNKPSGGYGEGPVVVNNNSGNTIVNYVKNKQQSPLESYKFTGFTMNHNLTSSTPINP